MVARYGYFENNGDGQSDEKTAAVLCMYSLFKSRHTILAFGIKSRNRHFFLVALQLKQSKQQDDLLPDNTLATFLCLAFLLSMLPQSLLSQTQPSMSHGFVRHIACLN